MRIDPEQPLFPISTVAEIVGCSQKVLRLYEKNDLVKPARSDGQRRLYSQRDIERIEFIHYITHVRNVNIPGVKVILELLQHIEPERWETIIRGVEDQVDALPADEKKAMEQGSAAIFEELGQLDEDS
ncbi:MerR family transcriptional regulator [Haliangium sp.]|uniref:MerR family transcriptional regulator n=1 Tax=Haliangium sp. TaxID=2663208 RepID=UPI003D0D758E